MKAIRNIVVSILFIVLYWLFIKSYFFDWMIFESIIYIFWLYIVWHFMFIFYKADRYFIIWLLLMSFIIILLSKNFNYNHIIQVILFHIAIWYMSRDVNSVVANRISVNTRSLMMYSSITFMVMISLTYAMRIATVKDWFSCDVLKTQTSQIIDYITLQYPRSEISNIISNIQISNPLDIKMSEILWISIYNSWETNISWNNNASIIISDWSSGIYVSDLYGTYQQVSLPPVNSTIQNKSNQIQTPTSSQSILNNLYVDSTQNTEANNINDASILNNLVHESAPTEQTSNSIWIIWLLKNREKAIVENTLKDKSLVDKGICEYIYEQVKIRQSNPQFIVSTIVLLFAILYPFFRFLFYIVGFVWRLILLILKQMWIYKIESYYQKIEKIE